MQETSRQIFEERSLISVEDKVVPVKEVFRLQNAEELAEAESRYLPTNVTALQGIILAQASGPEFHELTRNKPKAMIEVDNRPILHRLTEQFREVGIKDIVVLRGFGKDMVQVPKVTFIDNDNHDSTREAYTLWQARDRLKGDLIVSFGDILFRRFTLSNLLQEEGDLVIAVDGAWRERREPNGLEDYVRTSRPYSLDYREEPVYLEEMNPSIDPEAIDGEWIGLLKTTAKGAEALRAALEELSQQDDFAKMQLYDVFNEMLRQGAQVRVLFIAGQWIDVDNLEDLSQAQSF
jgi:phosphoenolpyruvate phosphomutase